ncbi:MAG: hypothetical protein FJ083_06165 [Cyanobacteria bacterium K_Offshore_surface_m2_239]|nr:hypothetical protein [Cyanobacteria bacterium K_Offshore_surface_m2_239]
MGADALEIDAEGLPLFRRDADCPPAEGLDVARALELEQESLLREDLDRCDIQQGGKAVRSSSRQDRQVSLG